VLALVLASCTANNVPQPATPPDNTAAPERAPLVAAPYPPDSIPQVSILDRSGTRVTGQLVYQAWIVAGTFVERESHDLTTLAVADLGHRQSIELEIGSRAVPAFVYLLTYTSTDPSGRPADRGMRQRCEESDATNTDGTDTTCRYAERGGSVVVQAIAELSAALLVVNVAWYVPIALRRTGSLPPEVSASWGFALRNSGKARERGRLPT
jgi:hypothetical protein